MSFSPNINVWTLGKGARGAWKLHHTTDSMEDAVAWFQKLEQQGKQVVVYELGLFQHEGHQIAGQVAFWWTANLNEAMEREPEDRGVGWSDGYDTWVEYTFPELAVAALPALREEQVPTVVVEPPEPTERYVEAACGRCGLILPMNQLHQHTHEVQTGRTSGTSRSSNSRSERYSRNNFSRGTSNGSSYSSGRKFYKTETLLLCNDCYAIQTAPRPETAFSQFWRFMTRLD